MSREKVILLLVLIGMVGPFLNAIAENDAAVENPTKGGGLVGLFLIIVVLVLTAIIAAFYPSRRKS